MSTVSLPLAELLEDMEVYPRHAVDEAHVASLVFALEAGVVLPPIVADKRSKRIVDGWHRYRAYKRVIGAGAVLDVELRQYANEAALLLDAIAMNSAHGRRLDAIDQTRAVVMLQKHKVAVVKIAMVLHVPEERIRKISVKVAKSQNSSDQNVPGTKIITLKRPVSHLQGETLTDEQVKVHDMLPGTSFLLVAKQLREALRVDLVNLKDDKLVTELKDLRDQLLKVFPL